MERLSGSAVAYGSEGSSVTTIWCACGHRMCSKRLRRSRALVDRFARRKKQSAISVCKSERRSFALCGVRFLYRCQEKSIALQRDLRPDRGSRVKTTVRACERSLSHQFEKSRLDAGLLGEAAAGRSPIEAPARAARPTQHHSQKSPRLRRLRNLLNFRGQQ